MCSVMKYPVQFKSYGQVLLSHHDRIHTIMFSGHSERRPSVLLAYFVTGSTVVGANQYDAYANYLDLGIVSANKASAVSRARSSHYVCKFNQNIPYGVGIVAIFTI